MTSEKIRFKIVGVFCTEAYQTCKYYADILYRQFPEKFERPDYWPMLDVQWTRVLYNYKLKKGGIIWCAKGPVVVFSNGKYFGNDEDLVEFSCKNYDYYFFGLNFSKTCTLALCEYMKKSERQHVYFCVTLDGIVVESFFIQLYNDLVPLTCANFMRLCTLERGGYKDCYVSRIVKKNWIQIQGDGLVKEHMACENYYVPHDQRGVVSMCNDGKHVDNSTQFHISLEPTPWMDYTYVAFGQVVHGEEVLRRIENTPTRYEIPMTPIQIKDCGEFCFKKPFIPVDDGDIDDDTL